MTIDEPNALKGDLIYANLALYIVGRNGEGAAVIVKGVNPQSIPVDREAGTGY